MNFSKTKKRNIIYLILVVVLAIAGAAGIFDLSEDTV
jgi:virulence family protein